MINIKTINKIAPMGLNSLDKRLFNVSNDILAPQGIMVRSASMHEMEFNRELKAIVRCGAGVNNIPVDRCAKEGIVVFNTPGANANAVKELTIVCLLLASRKIVDGIAWANTLEGDVAKQVEKGKSTFSGCEIMGKTLGVIGLGAIGGLVANAAISLGMKVIGYDSYLTVDSAWHLSSGIERGSSYDDIYAKADYITLHIPSTPDTKGIIDEKAISMMKQGVKIINLSRGDLVNVPHIKKAIEEGKVSVYVTDFPGEETLNCDGIIAIPHLGASTVESEDNCAVMAAQQLSDFMLNGNIKNSVNYPDIYMSRATQSRLLVLHKNVPNMLSAITGKISAEGINIENLANRSKGDYACTMVDTSDTVGDGAIKAIEDTKDIIRVIRV